MSYADIVRTVHEEYIRAGADVITANTFATSRHVLAGAGLDQQTVAINRRAVELACEARVNTAPGRPVWVAGSMSNMVAWIEGTISPDPRYLPSRDEEAANYREVADIFAEAGADILLLEMMSDIDRASLCLEAALATGLPVWVGLSCSLLPDGSMIGWDISREEHGRRIRSFQDGLEPLNTGDIPWRFVARAKGEFHVRQRCCSLTVAEERCGPVARDLRGV